jgi:hypothetical protein
MNDNNLLRHLNQALGSVRSLVRQRDLFQIALAQWVAGNFVTLDAYVQGPVRYELWFFCAGGNPDLDIVLSIKRYPTHTLLCAHWADELIDCAASNMTAVADGLAIREDKILEYATQIERLRREKERGL